MAEEESPEQNNPKRRDFIIKASAVLFGSILGLFPAAAGILVFLDPLRRQSGSSRFIPVAPLDSLPEDGRPQLFKVYDDRRDAWNKFQNVPVGSVYLRRSAEGVQALNAACPHLGCLVDVSADGAFLCPCHNSPFTAEGAIDRVAAKGKSIPSPRAMDGLEAKVENGMVLVQYQNFRAGIAEKIPKT